MSARTSDAAKPGRATIPMPMVLLLATTGGLAVASIYYAQPMLPVLSQDLQASTRAVGFIPTLTQIGYAMGILLLAPLGDRHDRRTIILAKAVALCIALLAAGLAPRIGVLWAASFSIGLSATLAQDIMPATAALAPPSARGRAVGTVMTGLLLGILLSRVVSGLVAERFGWRSMFLGAALSIALVGVAAWRALPRFAPTTRLSYVTLLSTLGTLWMRHRRLRRAAYAQGLLSVGFSAFWSTLAVMLHEAPFHLGSAAAGAFGLAGAVGALGAPLTGRLADARGPETVTRLAAMLAAVSFGLMAFAPLLPPAGRLALLAWCAVGFDLGVQASLVAHQTIIFGLDPEARGRLNAVLFTSMFIGMALGSGLGALAFAHWGWPSVTALATLTALAAWVVRAGRPGPRD